MDLAQRLDQLRTKITRVTNQLYHRAGPISSDLRTLRVLTSLEIVLKSLISHFANDLFVIGLEEITNSLPPSTRAEHTSQLWKAALPEHPIDRLLQLRKALKMHQAKK